MKKIISLVLISITLVTFVGCAKQQEVNVSVNDIFKAVKEQMTKDMIAAGVPEDSFKDGQLPRYMETDLTTEEAVGPIAELFNKEDIEEGIVLQHMMNVKSDLIIVLKGKDEEKVVSLKEALDKVKESQENIWSQYLPDQYEKVKNNITKVEGKYLIYITADNAENIEAVFDNSLKLEK